MAAEKNAEQFTDKLLRHRSDEQFEKLKHLKSGEDDKIIGVRMGTIFALAKEFMDMPPDEIEKLLASPIHELRVGAVSIMDYQARNKKTSPDRRKELFGIYIKCHDRINNWDLVDRSAHHVVGSYLFDKPRDILYQLARSKNFYERRTAIVSTGYFIKAGDLEDTYRIAEILLNDEHPLIQKSVGWMLREAGKRDRQRLLDLLDSHAARMPRTLLRYAIEHLDQEQRDHYLKKK
jgi:3-methyladenine DNA glycosylase AlkD